jgi:predicted PhzF superfamily epimerase YddE/YHI9
LSIFSDNLLAGNPASVILLDQNTFDNETLLKKISSKINLSETSFVLCEENEFKIKWFSPIQKVEFCGHGTLASAFVLKQNDKYKNKNSFYFKSDNISLNVETVSKNQADIDLPVYSLKFPLDSFSNLFHNKLSGEILRTANSQLDLILEFSNVNDLIDFKINEDYLLSLNVRGLIISFRRNNKIYYRYFCPKLGFLEDPATGSALSTIYPFYFDSIDINNEIEFVQLSNRGGISNLIYGDFDILKIRAKSSLIYSQNITID